MNVVLISTYDLGRQPFGLSSPAAWLRAHNHTVTCLDVAVQRLDRSAIATAGLVAFYVPMHTAMRIAARLVARVQTINPTAHLCFYGLYAPLNTNYLHRLGVNTILGGEFEQQLVQLADRLADDNQLAHPTSAPIISLAKQQFLMPDRTGLPALDTYAYLDDGAGGRRIVGYTEATRGCKHLCRHCPIVPVYNGQFRVIQPDIVLADIRAQVTQGAQHITFGDPDFFNGPGHALRIVTQLHAEHPTVTYDVTIKVEHLIQYAQHLPVLKRTGCTLITSAVEAIDPDILEKLNKGHTVTDFVKAVSLMRDCGLVLNPTFVTFTPWTTPRGYVELLAMLYDLDLIEHVAPIQYAIRLLIPAGSRLLELPEVKALVGEFDEAQLCYPWAHPHPAVDQLYADVLEIVKTSQTNQQSRPEIFFRIFDIAARAAGMDRHDFTNPPTPYCVASHAVPYMSEPWYC